MKHSISKQTEKSLLTTQKMRLKIIERKMETKETQWKSLLRWKSGQRRTRRELFVTKKGKNLNNNNENHFVCWALRVGFVALDFEKLAHLQNLLEEIKFRLVEMLGPFCCHKPDTPRPGSLIKMCIYCSVQGNIVNYIYMGRSASTFCLVFATRTEFPF